MQSQPPAVGVQWSLLLTSWVGLFLGAIIVISSTFSVLLIPISSEFGWTRSQMGLAYSLFSLTSTLSLPATGVLVDMLSARSVITACVLSFGILCVLLRFVQDLWQLYALFIALGVISGGTSSLPYFKVLVRAFGHRRGAALGFANSGTAVGTSLFPLLAFWLNARFGWRDTYSSLGTAVTLITVPVVLYGLRVRPKSAASGAESQRESVVSEASMPEEAGGSLSGALRTPSFWLVALAFFLATGALVGFLIHMVPLLRDRGMAPERAALAATGFGAAQFAGRLGAGWLLDRLSARRVAAGLWGVAAVSFVALWSGATGGALFLCAALAGLAFGGEGDVLAFFVGRLFGTGSFGKIYSMLLMINLLGAVVGPYVFGMAFDKGGSYTSALGAASVVMLMSAATILYRPRSDPPEVARAAAAGLGKHF